MIIIQCFVCTITGTVSYDENTYSEDTYYNGSNDTSSQEDADIYQIPYGEEETYYTE